MSVSTGYRRERKCDGCGKIEMVRKDNKASVCGNCSRKISAAKGAKKKHEKAMARRKPCEFCGEKVKRPAARFCSVKCKSDASRVQRQCKHCGSGFSIPRSLIEGSSNSSGNFCTRACYEKYLCNGERTTGRGSQWKKHRDEAIRRFPFCAKCGTTKNLQVHHITPFRLTRDNTQKNLVPLCVKHHKEIEMMFVETERFGVTPETEMIWRNMIRSMQATTAYRIKEALNATA